MKLSDKMKGGGKEYCPIPDNPQQPTPADGLLRLQQHEPCSAYGLHSVPELPQNENATFRFLRVYAQASVTQQRLIYILLIDHNGHL